MSFAHEEEGQIGPFEELYELILVVILLFVFASAVARSYLQYDARRESVERFSAGVDFSWRIRNSVLPFHVDGAPNPGLLSDAVLVEKGSFIYLNQFWGKPYDWEAIVRDMNGSLLYEFGSLNKDSKDSTRPRVKIDGFAGFGDGVAVVYSPIALRHSDGATELARMEVWVW